MKQIDISTPMYPDTFTLVDDADFDKLNRLKWYASKHRHTFYAVRVCTCPFEGRRHMILMHRQIISTPADMSTDHRNGNGLDNQRCNLRICTNQQNHQNEVSRTGSSRYKGVYWCKRDQKWNARITHNGKAIWLGSSYNEIDAAKVYDKKARELQGEFVRLNLPTGERI